MKSFILTTIALLTRRLVDPQTWETLADLVDEASQLEGKTGEQKRQWVVSHSFDAAQWVVNLVIEVIVAQKRV